MKKSDILFSIITCTYNSEEYLNDNLKSVEEQTCNNYEHIFVDGHSSDSTASILKNYLKRNKNSRMILRKPLGISDAMNVGIKESKGKYIIHLNSDDLFATKTALEDIRNKIITENYPDFVVGKILEINNKGDVKGSFPPAYLFSLNKKIIRFVNIIPHQSIFVKRSVFDKYGFFDKNLKYCMDYDFWLRTYERTRTIFADFPVSKYRTHKDSASTGMKKYSLKNSEGKNIQLRYSRKLLKPLVFAVIKATALYHHISLLTKKLP